MIFANSEFILQKSSPRKRSVNTPFEDGSDESETSSICSEKSTDYARRTSDVSFYCAKNFAKNCGNIFQKLWKKIL